jgi:maltose alpha-D-glucosyltransferase/alpha-amylase
MELGKFLTEEHRVPHVAQVAGALEYRRRGRDSMAVAILHGYVVNEGDAWQHALDHLSVLFEAVATLPAPEQIPAAPLSRGLDRPTVPPPDSVGHLMGSYLALTRLLGNRLGEIHLALAGGIDRPEFVSEPISMQYQRSLYQSMRTVLFDVNDKLGREHGRIAEDLRDSVVRVRALQPRLLQEFHAVAERPILATRIRCPGDCHLHQVLFTGKDYVFIDFEGPPEQSVGERRIKRSPFRDVVTMIRSFDYAASAALYGFASGRGKATGVVRSEDRPALLPWVRAWRAWVHDAFLDGYFDTCAGAAFIPAEPDVRNMLFRVLLLDRLLLEVSNVLQTRPRWLGIPLEGLLEALSESSG